MILFRAVYFPSWIFYQRKSFYQFVKGKNATKSYVQTDATTLKLYGQQCWQLWRPWWQWCANRCNNSQNYVANNVGSFCVRDGSGVQTDATALKLCGRQCWQLLRPWWQWCANRCNNSQQCWDLQCIMGRIQLIRLCKPSNAPLWPNNFQKSCGNGSDKVALCFGDHRTEQKKC